jgi:AmiR/NasT family two-component response regulator
MDATDTDIHDRATIRRLQDRGLEDRAAIQSLENQARIDRDKIANLEMALITARRIGAAMGVLMARHRVTDAQAFDLLRQASQNKQRKLREIAEDVILTGTLGKT